MNPENNEYGNGAAVHWDERWKTVGRSGTQRRQKKGTW